MFYRFRLVASKFCLELTALAAGSATAVLIACSLPAQALTPQIAEQQRVTPFVLAQQEPSSAESYFFRGLLRYGSGDRQGALADYNRAIELDPNYALAYYNRGVLLAESGNRQEALADFDRAIELDPNYADAYNNRGFLLAESSDHQGALADFNRAIELDPNNALDYSNRGLLRADSGDLQGAIADLQRVADLFQAAGDTARYEQVRSILRRLQQ